MEKKDNIRTILACVLLLSFGLLNVFHYELFHSSCKGALAQTDHKQQYDPSEDHSTTDADDQDIPCPFCMGLDLHVAVSEIIEPLFIVDSTQIIAESVCSSDYLSHTRERAPPINI